MTDTPYNIELLEQAAAHKLKPAFYDYFAGGATDETTLEENCLAYRRRQFRPKVLRNLDDINLETQLLGRRLSSPLLASPTAFHCLAHEDGELATAEAICDINALMICSMAATHSIKQVEQHLQGCKKQGHFWQQLYIQSDHAINQHIIDMAEAFGCEALVITVDSPVFGKRERDYKHQFFDLPEGLHCENLRIRSHLAPANINFKHNLNWNDIETIRTLTDLPIVLKGICHPNDARVAINQGIDGIIVSNHGGRQLDTVAATLDLLPDIVAAVSNEIPVLIDGGIRRGTDILKALALGATAVGIGRPIIWGLNAAGYEGVKQVFDILLTELEQAMALTGCASIADISPDILFES